MRLLRHPSFLFTLVVVVFVAIVEGGASIDGRQKLAASGVDTEAPSVSVMLEMRMPPEQYHMTRLQAAGRLARVDHTHVYMSAIQPQTLRALLRERWIARAERWKAP
jgi:hypothetical protein